MTLLATRVREFFADERGATALEYGLFAALIAAVIVLTVSQIGTSLQSAFVKIKDALAPVAGTGGGGTTPTPTP